MRLKETEKKKTFFVLMEEFDVRVERLVSRAPVFLFLEGAPDAAEGASGAVVRALQEAGVMFSAYNVLDSQDMRLAAQRRAVRDDSKLQSVPLLFVQGKAVADEQRVALWATEKKLREAVPESARGMTLEEAAVEHCKELVKAAPVVVFIKVIENEWFLFFFFLISKL